MMYNPPSTSPYDTNPYYPAAVDHEGGNSHLHEYSYDEYHGYYYSYYHQHPHHHHRDLEKWTWQCSICSFMNMNVPVFSVCDFCGQEPQPVAAAPAATAGVAAPAATAGVASNNNGNGGGYLQGLPKRFRSKKWDKIRQRYGYNPHMNVPSGCTYYYGYHYPSSSPQQQNMPSRSNSHHHHRSRYPYCNVTDWKRLLAMDCEMVGIGPGGKKSALARVTIVDWHGGVVLDKYVKPAEPITDYRTHVSGITPEILNYAAPTVDLETARWLVSRILYQHSTILIGHALANDLAALGMSDYPTELIRDTATYEPLMKIRAHDGCLCPRSLKELALENLGKVIQQPNRPHCPREDANTAFDLYKQVRKNWENSIWYKQKQQQYHKKKQHKHSSPPSSPKSSPSSHHS